MMTTMIKANPKATVQVDGADIRLLFDTNMYILRQDITGSVVQALKENAASTGLVTIKPLGSEMTCGYGGPATMCELGFKLADDTIVYAYFARITEAQSAAKDTITALTMPVPWAAA
jgi:hypothetical protein